MPFYKLVGNRILTSIQNALTGLGLSEYHTGYRGYSTAFLSRVPFELDTNDFHFDTEILLQAAHLGARIVEFPIPTRYADEVSAVAGLSGFATAPMCCGRRSASGCTSSGCSPRSAIATSATPATATRPRCSTRRTGSRSRQVRRIAAEARPRPGLRPGLGVPRTAASSARRWWAST